MINLNNSFTSSNKNEAGEKYDFLMAELAVLKVNEAQETQEVQEALPDDSKPKVRVSEGQSLGEIKNESPKALTSLQDNFALFSWSSISVIDKAALLNSSAQAYERLKMIDRTSGTILIKRHLAKYFPSVNQKAIVQLFFEHPETTVYKGVDFNPVGCKPDNINLWVGPTLAPKKGTWENVKDFLLNIICSSDEELFAYLIKYLAHALQKPEYKPGVMITLLGGEGIGKGTLMKIIMMIWGATTYKTNRIDDVVGQFNSSLEGSFWILLDEAHFAGDAKSSDALKSIVTESTVSINQKNQPQRMIPSLHRFMSSTNQTFVGKRGTDDRRDLTIKVSEIRKKDTPYWKKLNDCLEEETAALMHDLLAMDIKNFNVHEKPDTDELLNQKLNTLSPEESWWLDCLKDGVIAFEGKNEKQPFIKTKTIENAVTGAREITGSRRSTSLNVLASNLMKKFCPSAIKSRSNDKFRHRGYILPTLEDARKDFEAVIGAKIDWDENDTPTQETEVRALIWSRT